MRGESIQHHTSERIRKDGTRIAVDISLSPIRNERGEVIGASSIAHDITAQRRSEEALRRNEKLATAGRLAAAVAHEINNPLEAVLNLIYLARHRPESQDQYLEMAEREVLRVAAIAQQMLGFVRESSSPSPLNVAATLDDVLAALLAPTERQAHTGRRNNMTRPSKSAASLGNSANCSPTSSSTPSMLSTTEAG